MIYWWVNQNQTDAHEVGGGCPWSPNTNSNGGRNRFCDAMTETQVMNLATPGFSLGAFA
jgi:hypothetical protein